jgi:L-fuconolactonase
LVSGYGLVVVFLMRAGFGGGGRAFVEGLQAVGAAGLAFDLLVEKESLPAAAALAAAAPDVPINLNHLGYPDVGNASAFAQWRDDLAALAAVRPTVYCKLSGLPQA